MTKYVLKKLTLLTIFSSILFVIQPITSFAENTTTTTSVFSNLPTRIWVRKYSGGIESTKYFEHYYRGDIYHGYLSVQHGFTMSRGAQYTYEGFLYRSDLNYTMPFSKKVLLDK